MAKIDFRISVRFISITLIATSSPKNPARLQFRREIPRPSIPAPWKLLTENNWITSSDTSLLPTLMLSLFRYRLFLLLAGLSTSPFVLAAPYSVEVLSDNPVAFYRLNEVQGSTMAFDASPNENHATFAGTPRPTLGANGLTEEDNDAAEFSGSSTEKPRILTPPLFNPALTSFTIEALFKTDATTQQAVIQQDGGSGRTLFFLSSSGGDVRSFLGGGTRSSGTTAIVGQIHHGALVFDDPTNTWTWYIDGVATASGTVNPESSNGGFFIGIHKNLTSNYFDGTIDEVAFYTHTLSAERIAEHVASMTTPPVLNSFTAAPISIAGGDNSTLNWEIAPDVTTLSIDQGIGDVLPNTTESSGSINVTPAVTTTYTITATTPNGSATDTITIYVDETASFRLNELVAQNSGPVADEDGDESDWIEIKNTGDTPSDLAGFYLTDDPTNLKKWQFPSTAMNADELLLIFASDKDRAISGSKLHTNFKLSSGGEYLALVEPDGLTIHDEIAPSFPPQYIGISYGRLTDGSSGYFSDPTPSAENGPTTFSGFVEEEVFADKPRGFYDAPFQVGLGTSDPSLSIRYTTDGSPPTSSTGTLYNGPIPITTTTILRTAAFRPGETPRKITTVTYLFLEDVLNQPASPAGYPSVWQPGTGADYAMTSSVAPSQDIVDALLALPTVSVAMPIDDLFNNNTDPAIGGIYANSAIARGFPWERACSAEFFGFPHGLELQVDCGMRVFGNASRLTSRPKHNLRLVFRSAYGPSELDFPVFGNDAWPDKVNSYLLRGQNGDSWFHPTQGQRNEALYMRDQLARSLQLAMHRPANFQEHVHLYLNGIYWGLYHTLDRNEDNSMAQRFGGAAEDWDVIKSSRTNGMEAIDGDITEWNAMLTRAEAGLAGDPEYASIQELIDLDNLIDYLLVNFYDGNSDWDDNNFQAARRKTGDDRWRIFVWDSERTFLSPSANSSSKNFANRTTRLHTKLRENAEYRLRFADRIHRHFFNDGVLTPASVARELDGWIDILETPLIAESARWGDAQQATPIGLTQWQTEVNYQKNTYMPGRTTTVLGQLRSQNLYPSIVAPSFNQHGGNVASGFQLTMTAPAGAIYYTLDGTDPRDSGGAISATGIAYTPGAPASLTTSALAKARVLSGGTWSALNEASFFVDTISANNTNLVISEINYHPLSDDDALEFIELMNISDQEIDLRGVKFIRGITFDFDQNDIRPISVLPPNERIVIVGKSAGFSTDYPGIPIAGEFIGDLSNSGENVTLLAADGSTIRDFRYNDKLPWPTSADGDGFTMILIAPERAPDHQLATSWRSSTTIGGNPTSSDAVPFTGDPNADLDSDGLIALLEYALGTDDNIPDHPNDIYDLTGPPENLTFIVRQNLGADDTILTIQTSNDLETWIDADTIFELSNKENLGNGNARFTWSLQPTADPETKLFIRIRAEQR